MTGPSIHTEDEKSRGTGHEAADGDDDGAGSDRGDGGDGDDGEPVVAA